jgi:hypothetical protein
MKKNLFAASLLFFALILASCGTQESRSTKDMIFITERIQYPVFIKNPYPEEADWWRENIEGQAREKFVNRIFDAAYSGKYRVFDYFNNPVSAEEIKAMGSKTDTVRANRPYPPYDEFDTVVTASLDKKLIHRIMFMEEWYIHPEKFEISKKVVGICPTLTVYADSNELKGYQPLFWIYFDEKYPAK